jgi:hypothetical protein
MPKPQPVRVDNVGLAVVGDLLDSTGAEVGLDLNSSSVTIWGKL